MFLAQLWTQAPNGPLTLPAVSKPAFASVVPRETPRIGPGGAPPGGSGTVDYSGPIRVVSGDTFVAYINNQEVIVGVTGVTAPTGNTQCGQDAIKVMRALVKAGVRLEEDPALTFDNLNRRMYHVTSLADGGLLAQKLASTGVVHSDGRGSKAAVHAAVSAAERDAAKSKTGCVWGGKTVVPIPIQVSPPTPRSPETRLPVAVSGSSPAYSGAAATASAPTQAFAGATFGPSGFNDSTVISGLTEPTSFALLPDGRILIAQKHGTVMVLKNGALLPTPFIDISNRVNDYFDHALLGIAADPNFATNGYIYLLYTFENNPADYQGHKTAQFARVTASGDTASPSTLVVLVGTVSGSSCNNFPPGTDCIPSDEPSHSNGQIKFAPDGSIFLTLGDGSSFQFVDPQALRTQDLSSLSGKLLHVSATGSGLPTNPFWTGDPNSNQSKVYSYGHRNSYRFNLKPGASTPFIGDVGWNTWESLFVDAPGANLGWPCYEGALVQAGYENYPICQALYAAGTRKAPLIAYDHCQLFCGSTAVTGGAFYTGTTFPSQYQGAYFYGDYGQGFIRYLRVDANNNLVGSVQTFATGVDSPVDLEVGADQSLYYLSIVGGALHRVSYTGSNTPPTAAAAATPNNGLLPLNVQFSSNGSFDPGGGTLQYSWDFGDGTPTSNLPNPQHTYTAKATYSAKLTVTNSIPLSSSATVRIVAGDLAPVPTITSPSSSTTYKVGDVINFSGSAMDSEDGSIPAAGLSWQVILHHCPFGVCHTHFFSSATGAGGTFTIPDHGDDCYFEIDLSATDSAGLTATTSVNLYPQNVNITLNTVPSGLQVVYNGSTFTAPYTKAVPIGSTRTIFATSPQAGGTFASWSDGGAQSHNVTVTTNSGFTANFNLSLASLALDGTGYAQTGNSAKLNFAGDWTMESWFKDETVGGYNHSPEYIVIKGDTNADGEALYLAEIEWGTLNVGERTAWGNQVLSYTLDSATAGTWHHLAVSVQASTRQATMYLDGVQVRQITLAAITANGSSLPLSIGRDGSTGLNWHGKLDDLRIWNVVRTPSQVAASYRNEIGVAPSSLLANYKFDDGSGTTASDTTANPAAATLFGGATWSATDTAAGAPAPTTPPVISAVQASAITSSTATITWTTDQASNSQVDYGTTTGYGLSVSNSASVTSHSVQLSGLNPSTSYHYRVDSTDAAGTTSSADFSFTTAAPPPPPVISNVQSSGITSSGATITWTTDQASSSQVDYGTTTSYGSSTSNASLVTSHSIQLSGLSPSTTYHYRVDSTDSGGTSSSGDLTFTTAPPPPPPVISNVQSSGVTNSSATVSWSTDEASSSQVDYGTTSSYGSSTTLDPSLVTSHSQQLSGLAASTTYHYRVRSQNSTGGLTVSGDFSFTTTNMPALFSLSLASGAYAEAPNASKLNLTGDWTVEAWFKDQTPGGYNHQPAYLLIKGDTNANSEAPFLMDIEWGNLVVGERTAWANQTVSYSLPAAGAGQWHHVAATLQASTRVLNIYLDGVSVRQGTLAALTTNGNALPLEIGRDGTTGYNLTGRMDDMRIWNVVRTSGQISGSYLTELGTVPAGLVANYKFDEGSGTTTADSAPAPDNASLLAGATFSTDVGAGAPLPSTPPVISSVQSNAVTSASATITWTTDQGSTSQVNYGPTTSYGSSSPVNQNMVTSHSVQLTGLTPSTLYHYHVSSQNAAGNQTTSGDFTFTTASPPPPPVISNVQSNGITFSSANIGWTTDQPSTSQVDYGTTASYGAAVGPDPTLVTSHSMQVTGLNPSTTYHFRVDSTDAGGTTGSGDFTFTTAAPPPAPVVSNVQASAITNTSATLTWTTDQASSSQVDYGTTSSYGSSSALSQTPLTNHSVLLSGLSQNTTYHYRVDSTDAGGSTSSGDFTFTTTNTLMSLSLSAGAYAEAPNASKLNITGDWTVEAWFKDQTAGGYNHAPAYLLIKGDTNINSEAPYLVDIEWGSLIVGERTAWNNQGVRYTLPTAGAGTWHHVAATLQASTRTLTIYVDGVQVVQGTLSAITTTGNSLPFDIGRDGSTGNFWTGNVHDVRVWSVVRTASQISSSYQSELTGSQTGLVANWKFDDGSGTTAVDSTSSPDNAALNGGATFSTDHP
jgi:glucose/arabinose dehydrogenase/phosphodiesterase/alkaline phosphatase D-like protein